MSALREWAVTVAAGAMVCALVRMLVPSGRFDRTLRFVTALFFLACLLSPLVRLGALRLPELTPPDWERARVEQRLTRASLDLAERALAARLRETLLAL